MFFFTLPVVAKDRIDHLSDMEFSFFILTVTLLKVEQMEVRYP